MRKKSKKSKFSKTMWIALLLSVLIVLVIFSIVITQRPPRKDAKTYFQITAARVHGYFDLEEQTLTVYGLSFNLTAIGGRASYGWAIPLEGSIAEEGWPRFNLAQGETTKIEIDYLTYSRYLPRIEKTPEGFYPLSVQIDCYETFGKIVVNATGP